MKEKETSKRSMKERRKRSKERKKQTKDSCWMDELNFTKVLLGNVLKTMKCLINDTHDTFYLYYMVKDHLDNERGNTLPPPFADMFFICTTQQRR